MKDPQFTTHDQKSARLGFVRHLGAHERLLYFYSKRHPRHFCVVAALSGNVAPDKFPNAFRAVQKRHPALNVSIHDDGEKGPGFFRTAKEIPLTFVSSHPELDWHRVVEMELAKPFDASEGPLLRATILCDTKRTDKATIVLTFHHGVGDGLSGVAVVHDLMSALDGRELRSISQRPPLETLAARKRDGLGGEASSAVQPAKSADELRSIAAQPLWRPFELEDPKIYSDKLNSAQTFRVLDSCRKNSTTLHGALCAAVIASLSTGFEKSTLTITSAINLRKMVGVGENEVGLFVGTGTVPFPLAEASDYWELARAAVSGLAHTRSEAGAMKTLETLEATLPPTAGPDVASGLIGALGYDVILTNLGNLHLPSVVGTVRLNDFWGPAVLGRLLNERVIGASSSDGELHLVQSSPAHIPSFIHHIIAKLLWASELNE